MIAWLRNTWAGLYKRGDSTHHEDNVDLDVFIARRRPTTPTVLAAAFIVFAIGLALLAAAAHYSQFEKWQDYLKSQGFCVFLLGHVGVALIVAAIAGAVYETYAHHKYLEEEIFVLAGINQTLADKQLDIVLERLMRPTTQADARVHSDLRKYVKMTVHSVNEIAKKKVPAGTVSLRFVARLLKYAGDTAFALANAKPEGQGHEIELPLSAAHLADEILAAELLAMKDSDSYRVVSDFATWRNDQLPLFWGALKSILERDGNTNVTIERVFCVFDYDEKLWPEDAIRIIERHWNLAHETYNRSGQARYNVGLSLLEPNAQTGIFMHRGLETCFTPQGTGDLARFKVSLNPKTHEFAHHWEPATKALVPSSSGGYECVDAGVLRSLSFQSGRRLFEVFRGDYRKDPARDQHGISDSMESSNARNPVQRTRVQE